MKNFVDEIVLVKARSGNMSLADGREVKACDLVTDSGMTLICKYDEWEKIEREFSANGAGLYRVVISMHVAAYGSSMPLVTRIEFLR